MKPLRRIVVVQPYGIGDLLFLTPVLRALRLIPSVEKVDMILGSRTDSVIRSNPHIDEIFSVDKDKIHRQAAAQNLKELWSLGKKLAANQYDLMLDYSLRAEYAFFGAFILGIKRRAGYAYKNRGFFHNIQVPLPDGFCGKHSVEFVCELAEKAGVRVEDRFLEFYPQRRDREAACDILQEKLGTTRAKFIVVSPGGGESWGRDAHFKRWPATHFAKWLDLLAKKISYESILILGSSREKELADDLIRGVSKPAINLCGESSLETGAALIEKSMLFVGNDGGLVHLAAALRKPIVAFYGPVAPEVYGPYPQRLDAVAVYKENLSCRPCYQKFRYRSDCQTRECLQDLQPQEVMEFLERAAFFDKVKTE